MPVIYTKPISPNGFNLFINSIDFYTNVKTEKDKAQIIKIKFI